MTAWKAICLLNFDKSFACTKNSQYGDQLKSADDFYHKWLNYLSNYTISEWDESNAKDESEKLLEKLIKNIDEYGCKLFDGSLRMFM